ncbi:MAG TPA: hypothetical protein VHT27_14195 [Solirubrobacteraceae bacterium]|nr:hypothetical protein [Solirubrobacteraceae bacterium]
MTCPDRENELPEWGCDERAAGRPCEVRGVTSHDGPKPSADECRRPVSAAELESLVAGPPPFAPQSADERLLRCVSSGYLTHGCSCEAQVPAEVVVAAWERERAERRGDRFFRFAWRGEAWLAYGLRNGRVRGVYCPEHRAEREERTSIGRLTGRQPARALAA